MFDTPLGLCLNADGEVQSTSAEMACLLVVEVIGARGLSKSMMGGAPDTFVELGFVSDNLAAPSKAKTKTVKGSTEPVFNSTFTFQVPAGVDSCNVKLYKAGGTLTANTVVGTAKPTAASLFAIARGWFPVGDAEIELAFQLLPLAQTIFLHQALTGTQQQLALWQQKCAALESGSKEDADKLAADIEAKNAEIEQLKGQTAEARATAMMAQGKAQLDDLYAALEERRLEAVKAATEMAGAASAAVAGGMAKLGFGGSGKTGGGATTTTAKVAP